MVLTRILGTSILTSPYRHADMLRWYIVVSPEIIYFVITWLIYTPIVIISLYVV